MEKVTEFFGKIKNGWNGLHLFIKCGIVAVALLIAFQAIVNLF